MHDRSSTRTVVLTPSDKPPDDFSQRVFLAGTLSDLPQTREEPQIIVFCVARANHAASALGGEVVENTGKQILFSFTDPDAAVLAAAEIQKSVNIILAGMRVRFAIGIAYDLPESRRLAEEPGSISACARTRAALSGGVSAVFTHGNKGARLLSPTNDVPQPSRIITLQYKGTLHSLADTDGCIRIGRSLDNDVILDDKFASRYHAEIKFSGGHVVLFDKSTNGTIVIIGETATTLQKQEYILYGDGTIFFAKQGDPDKWSAKATFHLL